ncbi:MAPEG family protein [Rheinheimera sp. 4Y26]|uniref:MAPEG family protein n=1 Tax=Rheinheimera sp. 4Y26 TaxID=2977811 RepID=UPI0021B0B9B3|nr:MAPEG family protein [Rheinheimera sp. 4Y26]MCT6698518.1 MAPEG family protein [Rheinheimera sp. 4Y26]
MSLLIWVAFALVLLTYLARIPVIQAQKKLGGYDYHNPRAQQAKLEGLGQRANAAHHNSFEALQLYLAAFIACVASGNSDVLMQQLAVFYLICRVAFVLLYWLDKAYLRSAVWVLGCVAVLTMLVRAALAAA